MNCQLGRGANERPDEPAKLGYRAGGGKGHTEGVQLPLSVNKLSCLGCLWGTAAERLDWGLNPLSGLFVLSSGARSFLRVPPSGFMARAATFRLDALRPIIEEIRRAGAALNQGRSVN
jgi:hypothetical protein